MFQRNPSLLAGVDTLGRYKLLQHLGSGGMGHVYEALDRQVGRIVAIKLATDKESSRQSIAREASAVGRVEHDKVVRFVDSGLTDQGRPYFAMELVAGVTLFDLVTVRGPCSVRQVVEIVRQLCDAATAVHRAGLVHRDIKPSNVMVTRVSAGAPEIKLIDFGLAEEMGQRTRFSAVMGTPGYVAPEVSRGEPADARADVFGIAALLKFLLTGHEPGTTTRTIDNASSRPGHFAFPACRPIEHLLADCSSDCPADRPRTARELGRTLAAIFEKGAADVPALAPMAESYPPRYSTVPDTVVDSRPIERAG